MIGYRKPSLKDHLNRNKTTPINKTTVFNGLFLKRSSGIELNNKTKGFTGSLHLPIPIHKNSYVALPHYQNFIKGKGEKQSNI